MVCFQTKNPNLGEFWRVLLCKILEYFMTIWSILRPLEIFYGHLVYFPRFGILYQEKSGNPAAHLAHPRQPAALVAALFALLPVLDVDLAAAVALANQFRNFRLQVSPAPERATAADFFRHF
jgi:hypothetical protein